MHEHHPGCEHDPQQIAAMRQHLAQSCLTAGGCKHPEHHGHEHIHHHENLHHEETVESSIQEVEETMQPLVEGASAWNQEQYPNPAVTRRPSTDQLVKSSEVLVGDSHETSQVARLSTTEPLAELVTAASWQDNLRALERQPTEQPVTALVFEAPSGVITEQPPIVTRSLKRRQELAVETALPAAIKQPAPEIVTITKLDKRAELASVAGSLKMIVTSPLPAWHRPPVESIPTEARSEMAIVTIENLNDAAVAKSSKSSDESLVARRADLANDTEAFKNQEAELISREIAEPTLVSGAIAVVAPTELARDADASEVESSKVIRLQPSIQPAYESEGEVTVQVAKVELPDDSLEATTASEQLAEAILTRLAPELDLPASIAPEARSSKPSVQRRRSINRVLERIDSNTDVQQERTTATTRAQCIELLSLLRFKDPVVTIDFYIEAYGDAMLQDMLVRLFELLHQAQCTEHIVQGLSPTARQQSRRRRLYALGHQVVHLFTVERIGWAT